MIKESHFLFAHQVLNGNAYNRKCDVYSFGICLWEIYCCDMPYPDLSFSEVTSAVVRQVGLFLNRFVCCLLHKKYTIDENIYHQQDIYLFLSNYRI